jgi:spore maturation protein CgeB
VAAAADADVVVKASGVGVFDDLLADTILELPGDSLRIFWDVDAPVTLAELESDSPPPLRDILPEFGLVLTYGGGEPVIDRYLALGARRCVPIYNALDPKTHHPVPHQARLARDLVFLGNRLPDREARVEEFFFGAVERLPRRSFLLAGSGWEDRALPANVRYLGHVPIDAHNVLNASPLAVLNVSRQSRADAGFSPTTRVFEAAGAAACVITDRWEGIELFLEPGREILVARDGAGVASLLDRLDRSTARRIGKAARQRVLAEHTYAQRAEQVEALLVQSFDPSRA